MWPEPNALIPLAAAVFFFVGLAPMVGRQSRPMRACVVAGVAVVVVIYLGWRIPETVLPANDVSIQSVWIWFVFTIEMMVIFDAAILFAVLLRRTDRRTEADRHEVRLRSSPPDALPVVDVFIATYNESIDVLEKTIVGALFLDWPPQRLNVWVLDDGRREWLRTFCAEKGAGYLTRDDNKHAKAGNINAALQRTDGDFVMILDADFVPRHDMLYRMMGFFDDPRVGIVQAPHSFFNHDPMQANLAVRQTLPDEQRLFFDEIMAGRDGWDCAFCCGSNSITRRAAIEEIGGRMPTESITEDILLTLTLLRRGYVTRYVNERLAVGLAPESLEAFFIQRSRWARGNLQTLFLPQGPLGPGLSVAKRLIFLPTHWFSQSLVQVTTLSIPAVYLLTGLTPLVNASVDTVFAYQLPALVAILGSMRFFAPGAYFPLAATVLGVIQAFRLFPTVIATLVKPFGHAFKVTPKGRDAGSRRFDPTTVRIATILIGATALGLLINTDYNLRIVDRTALIPVVAFWSGYNILVLMLVIVTAFAAPARRAEERFEIHEPARIRGGFGTATASLADLSLSGALVEVPETVIDGISKDDWVWLDISEVGEIPALVVRTGQGRCGLRFYLPRSGERDLLIAKLFSAGLDNATHNNSEWRVVLSMLGRLIAPDHAAFNPAPLPEIEPPELIRAELARRAKRETGWELAKSRRRVA